MPHISPKFVGHQAAGLEIDNFASWRGGGSLPANSLNWIRLAES
jgi:hypothetical protein